MLATYPNETDAQFLAQGFEFGFPLNYKGPRLPFESKNLKSIFEYKLIAQEKINQEIALGRIAGPFDFRPISNLRCSPIGIVPKKTGGFRLITHLSHPAGFSVNEYIDPCFTSVQYSSFDHTISIIQKLGTGALLGKMDIKSAFRLLPMYPGDFDLLGFKFEGQYFVDKMMVMGASNSCNYWEKLANFLQWVLKERTRSDNIDHYLDDFIFAGHSDSNQCWTLMNAFQQLCSQLGVPIADEKTEGPTTCLTYLGYELDAALLQIRIPQQKITDLLVIIEHVLCKTKITLEQLQSLTGKLSFCAKAMPSARAFIRRMYSALSQGSRPHHMIRLNKGIKDDLVMWRTFLTQFNGVSYMLNPHWLQNDDLCLQTDSAGGSELGCGVYFEGKWAYLKWPSSWAHSDILKDITFLELIPIALAIFLWKERFRCMRLKFACDNMALVHIINAKTAKSERVMHLVRQIVLWSLQYDFHINAFHVFTHENKIADCISRLQWDNFKAVAPQANPFPEFIPQEFWTYLPVK